MKIGIDLLLTKNPLINFLNNSITWKVSLYAISLGMVITNFLENCLKIKKDKCIMSLMKKRSAINTKSFFYILIIRYALLSALCVTCSVNQCAHLSIVCCIYYLVCTYFFSDVVFQHICLHCCEGSITNYTSFNPRKCRCKITKIGDLFEIKTKQTS